MGTVLNLNAIKALLPVRYPLLMLDRAEIVSGDEFIGVRNLTVNELFFQGHFPNHPILPGVLQLEAMKQLGTLGVADKIDPSGQNDIYLKALEKVKFRKPNFPGDRMKIAAKLKSLENNEAVLECAVTNNSGVTCEAILTLAVREKRQPSTMPELWNELDKSEKSVTDIAGVMEFMPHRYPFLFVDYIALHEGDRLVSVKNLSGGEEFFNSCPDDYKTMPESLMCEAMAQAGCSIILSMAGNKDKLGYFMSIDRAEFFEPAFPGDQLACKVVLPPLRGRFGKSSGVMTANGRKIMEITLMFALVDK